MLQEEVGWEVDEEEKQERRWSEGLLSLGVRNKGLCWCHEQP